MSAGEMSSFCEISTAIPKEAQTRGTRAACLSKTLETREAGRKKPKEGYKKKDRLQMAGAGRRRALREVVDDLAPCRSGAGAGAAALKLAQANSPTGYTGLTGWPGVWLDSLLL